MNRLTLFLWIGASAALGMASFCGGYKLASDKAGLAASRQWQAVQALQTQHEARSREIHTQYAQREATLRTRLAQQPQQIIRYVQAHPYRLELPAHWRLQHDAAAGLPEPASAPRPPADTAQPVDDLTALTTVTDNYAHCQRWRLDLEAWQAWYAAVKAVVVE
ncbi:hypothetical protein [Parachitinimonas caeni]|uniref:Uncharacterized protein n=1 Tax=Parachitinimonas caeni TaxID=3031301 RepID=A0ABT7DZH4_9NEIS|nr:hypothetical protein [Parachitinimonas caeni]MDK2125467.1 hypothetical protein [Parachitinimonas caeni]